MYLLPIAIVVVVLLGVNTGIVIRGHLINALLISSSCSLELLINIVYHASSSESKNQRHPEQDSVSCCTQVNDIKHRYYSNLDAMNE